MAITFKAFSECVPHVAKIKKPVMIRGRHGIGKSEVVYAFGKFSGLEVVERRASQMTEGDLLGLPRQEGDVTRWLPPEWFKKACDNAVLLFVDEIDRATTEVRQGFFELTDSRKLAGYSLHPDTLIFAAVNGGEAGEQYQVSDMDPAELDRWTVFDLEPSVDDWLTWAARADEKTGKRNVMKIISDFVTDDPKHLEHNSDYEPHKVYPSRRSWHRLSDCLCNTDMVKPGKINPVVFNLVNGFVGMEAAHAFQEYVRTYQRVITPQDILKGNYNLDGFTVNEYTALVKKFENDNIFKPKLSKKEIKNLGDFFKLLPSEIAMLMWEVFAICENDENFAELHTHISEHLVNIANGEQKKKENGEESFFDKKEK